MERYLPMCVLLLFVYFYYQACSLGVSGQEDNRYRQWKDLCNESFEEGTIFLVILFLIINVYSCNALYFRPQ